MVDHVIPQQACGSMPVDIITMDVTHQLPYGLRRQQIGQVMISLFFRSHDLM